MAMVEIQQATKRYGQGKDSVLALDGVDLSIEENEFFTLLGPSGCGKTTLLRLIAGFEQPTSGQVLLDGEPMTGLPPFKRPVNTVFQNYSLFPHMNVAQNIAFGLEMQGYSRSDCDKRVSEVLSLVRLEEYHQRRPSQLSGGQQQRIALARALANNPKVLLLDEPLSALDLKLRKEMQIELKHIQMSTGTTFVFVTHDQEEALTMSDRIAVMQKGHILQIGSPTEIYEKPTTQFVADFIGESNFLQASYLTGGEFQLTTGESLLVTAEGGAETSLSGKTLAQGDKAKLAIRPEKIHLYDNPAEKSQDNQTDSPQARENVISGKLEDVVYMGTDTIYHLKLASDEKLMFRVQNHRQATLNLQPGSNIRVQLPRESIQVLTQ